MKTNEDNIFHGHPELKKQPFSVPEGYFEEFKARTMKQTVPYVSLWDRLSPYVAVAAVFLFLVTAGTFILKNSTPTDEISSEDYLVFSEDFSIMTIYDEMENTEQIAAADLMDNEIIEYLIYTGTTVEEVELSK